MPGWRETFCSWIFERLHASDRQLAGVLKWLEAHDPDERLFGTPGDVLAVVGRAWESSISRLRPDGLIRWWVERRVTGTASDGGARKDWLAALGEKALRALADAAFDDAAVSFPARGSADWWSEKLPAEIAPAAPVMALRACVQEIAQEPRSGQRAALARAWAGEAMRVSALEAIGHLRAANVFQPAGAGALELAPPWVVEWWAEARAKELMLRGEPCVWGRLAATPSRRRLIEKTLDALERGQLLALIERALRACAEAPRPGLGAVGAVEALFGAVGRRWLRSPAGAEGPLKLMHALLARQRAWLMPRPPGHIPRPLTRASSEQQGDAAWIAECWAWSFTIARPAGFPDNRVAWLFPGWNPVSLATQPGWLRSIYAERSPSFDSMSRWAGKVLQKVKDADLPAGVPEPLLIEAMVHARAKGWAFGEEHVDGIVERAPLAHMFVKRISALDFEHRRSLLGDFWQILSAHWKWSVPQLRKERPELLELLVDGLDLADVAGAAERGCIKFGSMVDRPFWPPGWWNAVMRVLVVRYREHLDWLRGVYLDADAAEIVEAMADAAEGDDYWVRSLWRVAPSRARERAAAAHPDPQAARWFFGAPRDAYASLLEIVHAPVGAWTRSWLVQILPDAGADAERVFQLLTCEGPDVADDQA